MSQFPMITTKLPLGGRRDVRWLGAPKQRRRAMTTEMPKRGTIAAILRQRTLEAMTKAGMTTEQIRRAMPEGKVETTHMTLAQKALKTLRARAAKVPES